MGRKGSGKSAIFYSVLDRQQDNKQIAVIDLNPASHNLSELRESLLSVMSVGVSDHTIAAFWHYILCVEILLELRGRALERARYNFSRLKEIGEIEKEFGLTDELVSGDFTARLDMAVRSVVSTVEAQSDKSDLRSKLTNILFETKIGALRNAVAKFADDYEEVTILFDNIDKGWLARGVETHDIRTIRHLIDVLDQIQRDLQRKENTFSYLLFIRSDVYDLLVEEAADRGKYNVIRMDWSDSDQFRYLLQRRVEYNIPQEQAVNAWLAINPRLDDGRDAVGTMVEASLMRPRFLIDLAERAVSFAVNRGHEAVEAADVIAVLEKNSIYIVIDFIYEPRDIANIYERIFY
ncbi:MAG: P-loop ATPase, Sll1717 family [Rhizobiaceae bacterium]